MRKDDRLIRCPIKLKRMLDERIDTSWEHYAHLRRAGKDVATYSLATIKPVWVIERASAQPQDVWKPLHIQANCCTAPITEIQSDPHVTGVRLVTICPRGDSKENDILFPENWFDQEGRTREPLTKSAMTNRDPHGFSGRRVPNVTTQATAPMAQLHAKFLTFRMAEVCFNLL
jgi:hypothetical protein